MTEKRDEATLPSPLVVMFWLNEQNQMRPIACATEDKREDQTNRAAQCFNHSVHDYVPFSTLESVTRERDEAVRRVGELETAARAYREQANALERNVYNEYHANESLSVHEVGQLCLRCSQTGAILEALITTDPAKDPTQ